MSKSFAISPGAPIPKRWMSPGGPIRVMCEPVEGYVLARRPQAIPFVLSVSELLGSARHPHPHGPFEPVETGTKGRER
ncbi:hypothetical protein [Aureimonas sp. AU22]|uniref:hypothetical protein n=1 Tax=Aureimonas sp. AU22 TaxID=1638162 RepID=UPI000A67C928|nr:hypothetical protein [Aureimonas sp. AU22]